jgi:hypothetical protein
VQNINCAETNSLERTLPPLAGAENRKKWEGIGNVG